VAGCSPKRLPIHIVCFSNNAFSVAKTKEEAEEEKKQAVELAILEERSKHKFGNRVE